MVLGKFLHGTEPVFLYRGRRERILLGTSVKTHEHSTWALALCACQLTDLLAMKKKRDVSQGQAGPSSREPALASISRTGVGTLRLSPLTPCREGLPLLLPSHPPHTAATAAAQGRQKLTVYPQSGRLTSLLLSGTVSQCWAQENRVRSTAPLRLHKSLPPPSLSFLIFKMAVGQTPRGPPQSLKVRRGRRTTHAPTLAQSPESGSFLWNKVA